jgi:predicted regulator of Ras-like GTPase activity (Roadblock/LC7/MglB family)
LNFQNILHDLVSSIPGAIGALFLDWEGETVEMLGARPFEAEDHDLKIMGAYQGIFLTQLRQICDRISAGTPHRFKIEFAKTKVLSCDLADGYYLVLVVDGGTNEGLAWQRMDGSRERLLAELS